MIRLIRPYISFEEVETELRSMFESGIFTRGTNVEKFRNQISNYTGAPNTFLTTSATTALWLCLKRLNVQPNDEVIVSDFSFPATANVVEDLGATPIFVDVSLETYNILPDALEAAITPKTRAVIVVDAFGNPTGLHKVAEICTAHNIPLIEDAACAIGSSEAGQKCGNIADMTCFSFHPRKLLTTGEGGAVTIKTSDWNAWFERKLGHGAQGMAGFGLDFVDYGYNFRMSEPQAVMGCAQIGKLDDIVCERNQVRDAYTAKLRSTGFVPQQIGPDVVYNVQSLVFRVPADVDRDRLITELREDGVETTIGTYCMSGCTYYREKYASVQPNAELLQQTTITLPCYAGVDVDFVCERILSRSSGMQVVSA